MTTPSTTAYAATPFGSWKIDHAAIRVPDFDTAIAWYAQKLDFRLKQSLSLAGLTFALLSPADDDTFVFELLIGPGADDRRPYQDLHDSYKTGGWHHMGFRVENVDGTVKELKRRGVRIVTEPRDVPAMKLRVAFFADPWGNIFEIIHALACED
jgi:catechol 2,3-dioxygenase-like lactoylglutathione lyase family enzyme